MKDKKTPDILYYETHPNLTLHEIVKYQYELMVPNHGLTPEEMDAEVKDRLEADDLSLLQINVRRAFADDAEADAWDAAEPQRNWDRQVNYITCALELELNEIDAYYPYIVRKALEWCDREGLEIPDECRAHVAEVNNPLPAEEPKRARLCFERQHLGGIEFKIWDLARAYWESTGQCWLSSRNVATQCKVARNSALKYMRQLIAQGWFELLEEAKPGTTGTAKEQSGRYRPVQHAEWVQKHGNAGCL
jgi:hypothetical protein